MGTHRRHWLAHMGKSVPPHSIHQCHPTVSISATPQCPSMPSAHLSVPICATHKYPSVPPMSAHLCRLWVPSAAHECPSVPPMCAHQCRLCVPISAAYVCPSVPPMCAHQCRIPAPPISATSSVPVSTTSSMSISAISSVPISAAISVPVIERENLFTKKLTEKNKNVIFFPNFQPFFSCCAKKKIAEVIEYHQKKALFVGKKGRQFCLGTV